MDCKKCIKSVGYLSFTSWYSLPTFHPNCGLKNFKIKNLKMIHVHLFVTKKCEI
jgi:hypothetical protein